MAIEELRKLSYTGHSFFITIPKKYTYALGVKVHDLVVIRLTKDRIELIPYERNDQCQRK